MATAAPIPPASGNRGRVAPWWHTVVFIVIILGLSLVQLIQQPKTQALRLNSRMPLYLFTIVFELVLLGYVWLFGLLPAGTRLRDLIGGKWSKASDVLRDIGIAILFWIVVGFVLVAMAHILGENSTGLRAIKELLPQDAKEMMVWAILSVTAGFCEEVVFRGYLQRQFFALTGRHEWAVVLQAVVFGWAHLYQGVKGAIGIAVYGALFGILAVMTKSLRPGMIQHASQDTFSGIVGSLLQKHKFI